MPNVALTDEKILRFMRFTVTESAAGTFTEVGFDTQLSIERGVIWMVHFAEFEALAGNIDDPAQNAVESSTIQLTRETKTAIVDYNDADVVEQFRLQWQRGATIGTDAGPMWNMVKSPDKYNFSPPIPYAASSLFVGVQGSAGSAQTFRGRVGYTIMSVSDKFFFRVAAALIG